jgi:hypothetical protein
MTKEMIFGASRSTVSLHQRPGGAKSAERVVEERRFIIEKNAKNQAYAFIISVGMMEEFLDYCRRDMCPDPMAVCVNLMSRQQ